MLPVLLQRQTLAEHLARLLDKLGLDRSPQQAPSLKEYLAKKYGGKDSSGVDPEGTGRET